jgi:hypothetical protein
MVHKVLRRSILPPLGRGGDAFARAVQMYASEMQSYRTHLANVAADPVNFQAYPAPTASPDIAASINPTTLQPDYEIVDYLPVEKGDIRALELRKDELHHQVQQMEAVAQHNLLPARKWRLAGLEYERAVNVPVSVRTLEDNQVIKFHTERADNLRELQLHHARLEAQIEDLNFDTINSWTPRPFGG